MKKNVEDKIVDDILTSYKHEAYKGLHKASTLENKLMRVKHGGNNLQNTGGRA